MDAVVLVLDPDPVMRRFCQRLLERRGLDVLVAGGATDALRLLAQSDTRVDVVLMPRYLACTGSGSLPERLRAVAPGVRLVCMGAPSPAERRLRLAVADDAVHPTRRVGDARLVEGDALVRAVLRAARTTRGAGVRPAAAPRARP